MNLNLIELLYEALHSEVGIIVQTSDVEKLRQKLYPLRKESEELQVLSFIVSPTNPNSELWIVKNGERKGQTD